MTILTTQKQLKELPNGLAEDITYYSDEQIKALRSREIYFNEVAWSRGYYGTNGLLLQGNKTKKLYKITSRTGAIFGI